MDRIKELAVSVALEELRNLVSERGRRHALALKGVAGEKIRGVD